MRDQSYYAAIRNIYILRKKGRKLFLVNYLRYLCTTVYRDMQLFHLGIFNYLL